MTRPNRLLETRTRRRRRAQAVAAVLTATLILASCAARANAQLTPSRPHLTAFVHGERIVAVVNGYQWSGTIADVASRPAVGLRTYPAPTGAAVDLHFSDEPGALDLAEWKQGAYMGKRPLKGTTFKLPSQRGDYTFEVTAHWGSNYLNYDFDIGVR